MRLGVGFFSTDISADIREVARAVEGAGFESLFVPEHTHIPTSRVSPYPAGGELPLDYARTLDPYIALMAAGGVTTTLRLGTGVSLITERDPIHLAKEVATLDMLTGGRVILGLGCGWNAEEMADHGTDPGKRWGVTRDRVKAVKALWSSETPSYEGPYVSFGESWQWPKPTQKPHVPIHIGGSSPASLKHAVEYADGWMPMPDRAYGSMTDRIAEANRLCDEAGRPHLEITVYNAQPKAEIIEHYTSLGVARMVFLMTIGAPAEQTFKEIEQLSALVTT